MRNQRQSASKMARARRTLTTIVVLVAGLFSWCELATVRGQTLVCRGCRQVEGVVERGVRVLAWQSSRSTVIAPSIPTAVIGPSHEHAWVLAGETERVWPFPSSSYHTHVCISDFSVLVAEDSEFANLVASRLATGRLNRVDVLRALEYCPRCDRRRGNGPRPSEPCEGLMFEYQRSGGRRIVVAQFASQLRVERDIRWSREMRMDRRQPVR